METFLWGVLLQFPMKYKSVLLRVLWGHVIDWGTTPLVPHEVVFNSMALWTTFSQPKLLSYAQLSWQMDD